MNHTHDDSGDRCRQAPAGSRLWRLIGVLLWAGAGVANAAVEPVAPQSSVPAGTAVTAPTGHRTANAPSALKLASKPRWQDLTAAQQMSLKPLAANWGNLSEGQKRKWMAIAAGYPKLSPSEQVTLHNRMTEWAGLSQSQRAQARLNFADTQQLAASQKAANWSAYQALSPDEKKKLVTAAPIAPTGAAAVAKPTQRQKLATVPTTRLNPKHGPTMAAAVHPVDPNTLLPVGDPASTQKN